MAIDKDASPATPSTKGTSAVSWIWDGSQFRNGTYHGRVIPKVVNGPTGDS